MKLFHFTRQVLLSSIFANGITRGNIPLRFTGRNLDADCVSCISLTEHGNLSDQKTWAWEHEEKNVRLTVEVDSRNPLLLKWKYVPDRVKMDRRLWKSLRGDPYKWWVLFGTIRPEQIIEVFNCVENRPFTPDELEAAKSLPQRQGVPIAGTNIIPWCEAVTESQSEFRTAIQQIAC